MKMSNSRQTTETSRLPEDSSSASSHAKVASRAVRILDRCLFLLIAGLLAAYGLICCANWWWFAELFTHFQWQYLVVALVLVVVGTGCRRLRVAVAGVVLAIVPASLLWPYWMAASPSVTSQAETSNTLLHWNVYIHNPTPAEVVAAIREQDPDFVLLQEINDRWQRELQPLVDRYPYQMVRAVGAPFGIAFFSKVPLRSLEILSRGELENYVLARTEQGITIVGVHVMSPAGPGNAALRDRQLRELAGVVNEIKGPKLLVGDLNATPWSPKFEQLLTETGLQDPRREFGLLSSWPNDFPVFDIPIDHVLPSREVRVETLECLDLDCGSDHRPLLCRFGPGAAIKK